MSCETLLNNIVFRVVSEKYCIAIAHCASGNGHSDVPMNLKSHVNNRFMFKGRESHSKAVR